MSLDYFQQLPLVAILRGVTPDRCIDVTSVLYDAGFRCIEVPLNSPEPFKSIELLVKAFGHKALIGAGTVTDMTGLQQVIDAGGKLMVSPNCDVDIIHAANSAGMVTLPGCATPTEMFAAVNAGADGIKLFPSALVGADVVKAVSEVLPKSMPLLAVGGINSDTMASFYHAGCVGFGFGGALFKPQDSIDEIARKAQLLINGYKELVDDKK